MAKVANKKIIPIINGIVFFQHFLPNGSGSALLFGSLITSSWCISMQKSQDFQTRTKAIHRNTIPKTPA
jgi:hypothetical protein